MATRLASLSPDLEAAIAAASPQERVQATRKPMSWLYCEVPHQKEKLRSALSSGSVEAAEEILQQLDEGCFAFQEQDKPEEALRLFSQARTASATVYAIRGEATETIYEAIIATDNLAGVNQVVLEVLRGNA